MKKTLVLFDFDGTITTKDTFLLFIQFAKGKFITGFVFLIYSPLAVLYLLKIIDGEVLKKKIMKFCFKGKTLNEMNGVGKDFTALLYKNNIIKKEFLEKIRNYRSSGAEVCVVSASIDVWLRTFCEREDINLLCTELEYNETIYNGEFATPNCNGKEKVERIRKAYSLQEYEEIIAYGNSNSDLPMFGIANRFVKV